MFDFYDVMSVSNINPCCLQRMNSRRTIGHRRGVATVGDNQAPPQALAEGVALPVNQAGFTDAEVRASLAQILRAIIMLAPTMTT